MAAHEIDEREDVAKTIEVRGKEARASPIPMDLLQDEVKRTCVSDCPYKLYNVLTVIHTAEAGPCFLVLPVVEGDPLWSTYMASVKDVRETSDDSRRVDDTSLDHDIQYRTTDETEVGEKPDWEEDDSGDAWESLKEQFDSRRRAERWERMQETIDLDEHESRCVDNIETDAYRFKLIPFLQKDGEGRASGVSADGESSALVGDL